MRSQEEYVLRTVEERGIRFVQLWFTDVLGTPKTFSITPAELENALDEGMTFDGSAIDGFSRVQESDVLARPDANTFQLLPWHGHGQTGRAVQRRGARGAGGPGLLRHRQPRRLAVPGCPRHVLRRALDRAHDLGFTFYAAPEIEYFYFADGDPSKPPVDPRLGLVLRTDRGRPGQRHAPAHGAHAGGDGHPRRARPTRGLAQPARDRPSLHRRPDHGRHRDDRAPGGQGDGPPAGGVRQLHAQAPGRGAGVGHAHPHVPVPGRHQRLRRPRPARRAVRGGRGVHRRPAPARPRDHRGDQPVGELLQAAGLRLRGPHPRVMGPQQPLGPGPGAGGQAGQARVHPGGVPLPRQRLQPLSGLRRHAGRRPARGSRRGTTSRPRPTPTSSPSAPRSSPTRASSICPGACTRPSA